MLSYLHDATASFRVITVPDVDAARRRLRLPDDAAPDRVLVALSEADGAKRGSDGESTLTRPWMRKVVGISAVFRRRQPDGSVRLRLARFPDGEAGSAHGESDIIGRFFAERRREGAQLVSYSDSGDSLAVLVQRGMSALAESGDIADWSRIPGRPNGFATTFSDHYVDLRRELAPVDAPSLEDLAAVNGLPLGYGLTGIESGVQHGSPVPEGALRRNEADAITVHLLLLRFAYFSGILTRTEFLIESRTALRFLSLLAEKEACRHFEQYVAICEKHSERETDNWRPQRHGVAPGSRDANLTLIRVPDEINRAVGDGHGSSA